MFGQLVRLATFATWPSSAVVSSLALARSGFKYTGHGESTVCTECQLVVDVWQKGDQPGRVHRQCSPNCAFVKEHLQANDTSSSNQAADEHRWHFPNFPFVKRQTCADSIPGPSTSAECVCVFYLTLWFYIVLRMAFIAIMLCDFPHIAVYVTSILYSVWVYSRAFQFAIRIDSIRCANRFVL